MAPPYRMNFRKSSKRPLTPLWIGNDPHTFGTFPKNQTFWWLHPSLSMHICYKVIVVMIYSDLTYFLRIRAWVNHKVAKTVDRKVSLKINLLPVKVHKREKMSLQPRAQSKYFHLDIILMLVEKVHHRLGLRFRRWSSS